MIKSKSKYFSYILRFVIAAAALYLTFKDNFAQVVEVLLGLNLWIAAASSGFYLLSQLIFVSRWNMLLRVQGIRIGYWTAVRLHFIGLFYSNCLPSAIGGDFLRAWYVTKHTDKKVEAALSVFVDRAIGMIGIFVMAFCCYWFIPSDNRRGQFSSDITLSNFLHRITGYRWILLGIGTALVIVMAVFILNARGRDILRRGYRFIHQRSIMILNEGRIAIQIYYNKKLALVFALLLTFACQSVAIVAVWIIGREIGVDANVKYYFIFFPISWIIGLVPISVGGTGITEAWLTGIFIHVCASSEKAVKALAAYNRILIIICSLPGAVIHLKGAHLPKDFSIDYKQPIN